ncbi:MAG: NUDIX hydrolase [Clostridia bacterium]|nr:NUDIX hydrolase [Clostridia bacterium]
MQKPILKKISTLTQNRWANMYEYEYEYNKQPVLYYVASRRKMTTQNANKPNADSVIILPYYKDKEGIKIVFIRQFRYAVNDFIYDVPAGTIDEGEQPLKCAIREVSEEIGASVLNIEQCTSLSYTTPGCLNETSITYFAEVKLDKKQNLQTDEIIDLHIVPLEEVPQFTDKNIMGVQGKMMAKIFYYQQKLKQAEK